MYSLVYINNYYFDMVTAMIWPLNTCGFPNTFSIVRFFKRDMIGYFNGTISNIKNSTNQVNFVPSLVFLSKSEQLFCIAALLII